MTNELTNERLRELIERPWNGVCQHEGAPMAAELLAKRRELREFAACLAQAIQQRDAAQAEVARLASSLAAVERQRDDLKQWIAAYRDKLGNYPETAHGQRVACDDILERMEAEPAQGVQP